MPIRFDLSDTNYVYFQDYGPPDNVVPVGTMSHTCQDDLVVKVTQSDVPYFNAPIYLENKQQVRRKNYKITCSSNYETMSPELSLQTYKQWEKKKR